STPSFLYVLCTSATTILLNLLRLRDWRSFMLSVYTRHTASCSRSDIHYRRCRCPKWIQGTLEQRPYFRVSARTRSWKLAEHKAREMEGATRQVSEAQRISVATAIQAFIADQSARKLTAESIRKSRL